MEPPILESGKHSVLSAELNTGIVLNTNFSQHIGNEDVFHIFETYDLAMEFVEKKLTESSNYEFNIYNSKGEYLLTRDKNGKR
ncbi:hypothetical protein [Aquimarina algiphila]|uniref:hypothetical protein n=1 Tax=Aquimarina algiphila TaxID=2047982 RepID=UPI002330BB73|nr:hypothetical protein [Aquimarina algiphila]